MAFIENIWYIHLELIRRATMSKVQNFVHKYGMEFNKSAVHVDRKKAPKRGAQKHKKRDDHGDCPSCRLGA